MELKPPTPVRVRPSRRSLFPLLQGPSKASRCSADNTPSSTLTKASKQRKEKTHLDDVHESHLGAEKGGFGCEFECKEEIAKRKSKRSALLGYFKSLTSKKSRSLENAIEDECDFSGDYDRAVALALHTLRTARFSIGETGDPWNGTTYGDYLQTLHLMESSGGVWSEAASVCAAGSVSTASSEHSLHQAPSPTEWLRLERSALEQRRGVVSAARFDEEVEELRRLLKAMKEAEGQVSSINFHNIFYILHHLHSAVEFDELWAELIVDACKVLHNFNELRWIVMLLLQMTAVVNREMDAMVEDVRTLILRGTVGECTQWTKLLEWQRDVITLLLMRRTSTTREKSHTVSSSSSTPFCADLRERSNSATLTRSTLTRSGRTPDPDATDTQDNGENTFGFIGRMRPGAEEALRDAGIMDVPSYCREAMDAAAKDLRQRLDMESARLKHGLTRPVFFPSIKGLPQ